MALSEKTIQQTEVVQKLELELVQAKDAWQDAVNKKDFAVNDETLKFNNKARIEEALNVEKLKLSECMREVKHGSK